MATCRARCALTLVGALAVLARSAAPAAAGCTEAVDASTVKRSLSQLLSCNDRRLRSGPSVTCRSTLPPPCAGTLITDAAALGYGPNNAPTSGVDPHALADQLRCQKRIGRGISTYVGTKLRGLVRGRDPLALEASARRRLDRIPDRCTVNVLEDEASLRLLPAVGPQCAAAVGDVGDAVDGAALRDCLATLLGVWVDRWGPNPQPLRPNILFILTDDQRWDTTDGTHGLAGADVMPRTRAELADEGAEFPEAFMTTPLCCPSRSSILSGSYAHRTGVYKNGGNNGGADDFQDAQSIAVWLAGYRSPRAARSRSGTCR